MLLQNLSFDLESFKKRKGGINENEKSNQNQEYIEGGVDHI